jgi:ABC-type glutathione transport system ATPase component
MIIVRDLTISYGGQVAATVSDLTVAPGEIVALAGESGAGKTSVALAVLGLATDQGAVVSGDVTVDGEPAPAALERALIGYVPQNPRESLPPATRLGSLITAALRRHRVPRGERAERIADALRAARADPGLLRRYPHQVSGGQAQRFAIALPLALRARYLVVDEPTSALDRVNQLDLVAELRRLRSECGTGVLVVSHDLGVISAVADRILVMWRSRVVDEGPVAAVFAAPTHPHTRELVASARSIIVSSGLGGGLGDGPGRSGRGGPGPA